MVGLDKGFFHPKLFDCVARGWGLCPHIPPIISTELYLCRRSATRFSCGRFLSKGYVLIRAQPRHLQRQWEMVFIRRFSCSLSRSGIWCVTTTGRPRWAPPCSLWASCSDPSYRDSSQTSKVYAQSCWLCLRLLWEQFWCVMFPRSVFVRPLTHLCSLTVWSECTQSVWTSWHRTQCYKGC